MAVIDVGPGATGRSSYYITYTFLCVDNPANDTGTLDTIEIYASSVMSGTKVGTFYGSSTSWTPRDYESIGTVSSGSKQTFTGLNCDVETNDLLGVYFSSGNIYADKSGYSGLYAKSGDQFGAGTQKYTLVSGDAVSIYATGATAAAGHPTMKRWGGVPFMRLNKGIWVF